MFDRTRQGAVDVVRGDEPLNADRAEVLSRVLDECLTRGQPRIVLDLEKIPLIDSAGLELLLEYQERCQQRGGALKLASPTPLCEEILGVTGVARQFEIYTGSTMAVGSFAQ